MPRPDRRRSSSATATAPRSQDTRAARELARALAGALLGAQAALEAADGTPVPSRRLVNHLRGSDAPPSGDSQPGPAPALRGVLWGAGAAWVRELLDALLGEGLLEPGGGGASFRLSARGRRALRGTAPVGAELLPPAPALGARPEVEQRLLDLRRALARAEGRPAFSVLDNATVARIARRAPRTLADLSALPGLGETRLRRYGRRILRALREG